MERSVDGRAEFPEPPLSFTDQEGREITVETYPGEVEPLVEMYEHFDTSSQSQGVPPRTRDRTEEWVEHLLDEGENVVATHEGRLVGHTILLPYDDTSELAIFVRPDYQEAGIGTKLIRALLGHGQALEIPHVWLTVSRDNRIAMRLYRSAGFEVEEEDHGEFHMERDL